MPACTQSIRRYYMEILLPVLLTLALIRLLAWPAKMGVRAGLGFLSLWLLNTVSGFTGLYLPINAITVLLAGFLGAPGVGIVALLTLL